MPYRRGHSDVINIDGNQMNASKIEVTIYQKHNKRLLFVNSMYLHKYNKINATLHNFII